MSAVKRFYAIKKLSEADITLFGVHLKPGHTRQKAINLNADVLLEMFPGLDRGKKYGIDLQIMGPGDTELNLQRKILNQAKNWRLNGEIIVCLDGDQDRFEVVGAGDYAVMEFLGRDEPHRLRISLITQAGDHAAHSELEHSPIGQSLTFRKTMQRLTRAVLEDAVQASEVPKSQHPVARLLQLGEDVEESVAGGGTVRVNPALPIESLRLVSPEEMRETAEYMAETGSVGEEIVDGYLSQLKAGEAIANYTWVSQQRATAALDFVVEQSNLVEIEVDVKSTEGGAGNPVHISYAEARRIALGAKPYHIYRVYGLDRATKSAQLQILDPGPKVSEVMAMVNELPAGVRPDSFRFDPSIFGLIANIGEIRIPVTDDSAEPDEDD